MPMASELHPPLSIPAFGPDKNGVLEELQTPVWETIMAVDLKDNGSLGCAYYSVEEMSLRLLDDSGRSGLDDIERLVIHIQPTTILVSARACDGLADYLENESSKAFQGMIPMTTLNRRALSLTCSRAHDRACRLLICCPIPAAHKLCVRTQCR